MPSIRDFVPSIKSEDYPKLMKYLEIAYMDIETLSKNFWSFDSIHMCDSGKYTYMIFKNGIGHNNFMIGFININRIGGIKPLFVYIPVMDEIVMVDIGSRYEDPNDTDKFIWENRDKFTRLCRK